MANLFLRLQELAKLATAAKSTMMVDQVLVLMEREIHKKLKLEEKFRELCSEMADTMKDIAEYRDMEKVTRLQIMMNQSHLGVREKLLFVQNLKDGVLG
ncbi:hypothetical protein Tco_0082993 [Tanacetum coccineum]